MAAQHTHEHAEHGEHAGDREPATPATVRGLAEAIAEQIERQQAADGNSISGKFDIEVVHNGIEYKLNVKAPIPTKDDPGYWSVIGTRTIQTTEGPETKEFLTFVFKDQNNWRAGAGLPIPVTIPNTGIEIKVLYGEFQMGQPVNPFQPLHPPKTED